MDQQPPAPQPMQPPVPPVPGQPVPTQPYAPQAGVAVENPGQTLGIVGLVCNFLGVSIAGIILGVMSRNKSKQVGMSTTLGTISMVWGIVATVAATLGVIFFILVAILAAASDTSTTSTSSSSVSSSN